LGQKPSPDDLSVDRPVDRVTIIFWQLGFSVDCPPTTPRSWPAGRPLGRPRQEPESTALLVGRLFGRPGPDPDSKLSGSVDRPIDRPSSQGSVHILCTSVNRSVNWTLVRLTDRSTARSPG